MTSRSRIVLGLAAALVAGVLGPALVAVAHHSGSGMSTISGKITQGHRPARGACASAWFSRENRFTAPEIFAGTVKADVNGNYTLRRLPADTYKVEFHLCNVRRVGAVRPAFPWEPQSEYWHNQPLYEDAADIVVGARDDITGIDAELGLGS